MGDGDEARAVYPAVSVAMMFCLVVWVVWVCRLLYAYMNLASSIANKMIRKLFAVARQRGTLSTHFF
jgi:hypothetical protein